MQARRSLARSKPKTVQTRCSFASAVSHTSVTAQSVTEAVAKATLDKPLFQHALHSIFSSLAWFGLAWIVTRYISRKSKECESPEEPAPAFLSELSPAVPRVKRPVYVHAGQALLVAINVPVAVFLPMAAVVYSLRSIAWFLGVALASETRRQSFSEPLVALLQRMLTILQTIDSNVLSFRKLGVIVFGCWTLLRFKECMMKTLLDESIQEINDPSNPSGGQGRALERVMLPVSGLASWVVVCAGSLMCLAILGINVQPLLTVGGVSTVLVGLSAQSVLANLISGINLFLSRPFVVGDRVELSSGGGERVMVGVIERVDPMRTIIRTDASLPVTIPNKVLSEMMISNESNILTSRVLSHFNRSRQLLFTIKLRYKDLEKVEIVVDEMRRSLTRRAGVDRRLPQFVGMSGFQDYAINIVVLVHTTPVASRDWGNFRQRLLMDFGRIINKHGVHFAYPTQVTHMPDLEEAIMNSVNNRRSSSSSSSSSSNSNNGSEEGSSSSGSNGASQPSSPSHQPHRNRAAELAAMEQSIEGGLPRPQPMSAGLAGKAAQGFGNEAYKSTDIL
ncbi:hypothetical protein WJX82_007782 [Trebouxia sp. C0006]